MKNLFRKILNVLRSPDVFQRSFQAINKSPLRHLTKATAILFNLKNYLTRRALQRKLSISEAEANAARALKENGYCELNNIIDSRSLETLLKYANEKLSRVEDIRKKEILKNKNFWIRLSDEDIGGKDLTIENPMIQGSLNESVLKIAASYLKEVPFLQYVVLTLSTYAGAGYQSSQLWHLDRDDTRMIKLFIYLSDVSEPADGPFTFLDRHNSAKIKNSFFMRHLTDEEVLKYVDESKYIQLIKPKLNCFMVDTSRCYHMGSRVHSGRSRLMFTALLTALPSNYPGGGKSKYTISPDSKLTSLQFAAVKSNF